MKPTRDRGRAHGYMRRACDPPTRPELTRGTCEVWDGAEWSTQETVTIVAAPALSSSQDGQG